MKAAGSIIFFICLFLSQNAWSYDECFDGHCYSHLNSGWTTQGGAGCVKTGMRWDRKYSTYSSENQNASFYIAINTEISDICNSPDVRNMDMLVFHLSSRKSEDFRALIKKAIDWCWLSINNKIKYSGRRLGEPLVTDNNLEVNLLLYSDASIKGTFVRLEIQDADTRQNYFWLHLTRLDLTRLKNELSTLKRRYDDQNK